MTDPLNVTLWLVVAFPILIILQRWIHRHVRGVALLITGNEKIALAIYALILLPGVFLHELSHWLTAGLLGVRTGRFSVWPKQQRDGSIQLGYVEYYRDAKLGPIRESLIGAAPLIYGTVAIVLISNYIFDVRSLMALLDGSTIDGLARAIRQFFATSDFFIWLYLLFAISNAMMPSPSDRRAWPGFLAIVLIFGLVLFGLDLWEPISQSLIQPTTRIFGMLAIVFTFTIVIDVVCIVAIMLLEAIVGKVKRQYIAYS